MDRHSTAHRPALAASVIISIAGIAAFLAGLINPSLTEKTIYGGYLSFAAGLFLCLLSLDLHHVRGFWVFVGCWAAGALSTTLLFIPLSVIAMLSTATVHLPLLAIFSYKRARHEISKPHALAYYLAAFFIAISLPHYLTVSFSTPYPLEAEAIEVASDTLTDKDPLFVDHAEMWNKETVESGLFGPISCEMNKSACIVGLDLAELEDEEACTAETLYSTYHQAIKDARDRKWPLIPSVQMIDHKAKAYEDRLLAIVEEHLFSDKDRTINAFLAGLLTTLIDSDDGTPASTEAIAYVAASLALGNQEMPTLPEKASALTCHMRNAFLEDPMKSRPTGFYADSEALSTIFHQSRFLQRELSAEAAIAMAETMTHHRDLTEQYRQFLRVYSGLCNPASRFSVIDVMAFPGYFNDLPQMLSALRASPQFDIIRKRRGGRVSGTLPIQFMPHATSKENQLFARLYNDSPDLPRHSVMNRLIEAIRSGELDLTPSDDSGWYDYQIHALETFLLPDQSQEGHKLLLTDRYKRNLIEAFQTILTKKRELHVKNVELIPSLGLDVGGRYLRISPDLSLHPTATYYLRTARGFRFVLNSLQATLGEAAASLMFDENISLQQKHEHMCALYYGLYLKVCANIGMVPNLLADEISADDVNHARSVADTWLSDYQSDPCYRQDIRRIVPVLTNADGTEVRYWMTLGVRLAKLKAEYVRRPTIRILDSDSGRIVQELPTDSASGPIRDPHWKDKFIARCEYKFVPKEVFLPVEVFAEATGPAKPFTRAEFQSLCDKCNSKDEIIRAVTSLESDSQWKAIGFPGGLAVMALLIVLSVLKMRRSRISFFRGS